MSISYVPKRGDYIFVNLSPTRGHEQRGHRPALVISNDLFNTSGTCFVCPITSKPKLNRPFTVASHVADQEGTIIIEHTRSIDWKARGISFSNKADATTIKQVQAMLMALIIK
jgi:mRNA interferase MazF